MDHGMKAAELFLQGYNCAQAVAVAFSDLTELEQTTAAKMVSGFGGGMGRLREVCGAVSGMCFVVSQLYGYSAPEDDAGKKELYKLIQSLVGEFRAQAGNILCRELLKNPPTDPNPSPRTEQYYKERPCARMVFLAGQILDDYIARHPQKPIDLG